MDQVFDVVSQSFSVPQRHLQRIQRQVRLHRPGRPPTDDHPGEHIDHERHIDEPGQRGDVREIDHPQLVRGVRDELAVHQVRRPLSGRVRDRGADPPVPAHSAQAGVVHDPLNGAPSHRSALDEHLFAAQLVVDLQHPVQAAPGCLVHPADLDQDQLVPPCPRRRWTVPGGVVGARGDLAAVLGQHSADRLDPEPDAVFGDEPDYHGNRGSSSRAKKLEAASRISLARLTSRSSASSFLILAASVDVVPGSRPASTWDCLTQLRSVSGTTPTRGPICLTAPLIVNDGSSVIASATNRTERSRNSCGYFLGAGMTPPFRGIRPSTKPGTIQPLDRLSQPDRFPAMDQHGTIWVVDRRWVCGGILVG